MLKGLKRVGALILLVKCFVVRRFKALLKCFLKLRYMLEKVVLLGMIQFNNLLL